MLCTPLCCAYCGETAPEDGLWPKHVVVSIINRIHKQLCFDVPHPFLIAYNTTVAYPVLLSGGGGSTNSVEDRENGDLGAVAPLVSGSGGSCNLVQEISFHVVNFFLITFMKTTNLFVIADVKQLRT